MDIQYYGANCVTITTAKARVVIDDELAKLGLKSITKPDDVAMFSVRHKQQKPADVRLLVDGPGEYEIADLSVHGVAVRGHMDDQNSQQATAYKFSNKDIDTLVLGNIYPELSDAELEDIGNVDVLVVPVGGNGYTVDPTGALDLIKSLEPKIIVPVHYDDTAINYEVPQKDLASATKELGVEVGDTVKKLRVKPASLAEQMQLVVIERS